MEEGLSAPLTFISAPRARHIPESVATHAAPIGDSLRVLPSASAGPFALRLAQQRLPPAATAATPMWRDDIGETPFPLAICLHLSTSAILRQQYDVDLLAPSCRRFAGVRCTNSSESAVCPAGGGGLALDALYPRARQGSEDPIAGRKEGERDVWVEAVVIAVCFVDLEPDREENDDKLLARPLMKPPPPSFPSRAHIVGAASADTSPPSPSSPPASTTLVSFVLDPPLSLAFHSSCHAFLRIPLPLSTSYSIALCLWELQLLAEHRKCLQPDFDTPRVRRTGTHGTVGEGGEGECRAVGLILRRGMA
ncbi:hypothetical protein C8R45DRAFT_297152 [Mycena sanguinolenta]|nr:hypothetical protein C8R45DRAFT_297152 [Mycena sanguinolenta]